MLAAHHLVVPGCNLQVLAAVRAHVGLGLESSRPVPKVHLWVPCAGVCIQATNNCSWGLLH